MSDEWDTSPTSKPKKKLTRKKKKNRRKHPFTSARHWTHLVLLVSWRACSQSALPLKSYRGAVKQPYVGLQMHWLYIITPVLLHHPPNAPRKFMLTWSGTVLVPRFISTETEKQNVIRHSASSPRDQSMLVPGVHGDTSECNCKAFGRLLFVIALRLLAVDPLLVSCAAACSYATNVPYMSRQPALCLPRWLLSGKPS